MKYHTGNYNRLLVGNLYDFDFNQNLPQEIKERQHNMEVSG